MLTNVLADGLAVCPHGAASYAVLTSGEATRHAGACSRWHCVYGPAAGRHAFGRATTARRHCRRIVQESEAILADEPIASLDPASARRVMETLSDINRTEGTVVSFRCIRSNTPDAIANALLPCATAVLCSMGRPTNSLPLFCVKFTARPARS